MKKVLHILLIISVYVFYLTSAYAHTADLKVAFLYHFPIGDAGWNYAHYLGQKEIEAMPGVKVEKMEGVMPTKISLSILNHLAKDNNLLFLTSYNYMHLVSKIAKHHPNTIFMNCAGDKIMKNVGNYFAKMYQARFLTGMVAGAMTKTNMIGYVAAFPLPEVVRGINAFTLGVRQMNPEAEIRVAWTSYWNNAKIEEKTAYQLIDMGADVLAQHQNSPLVQIAAEKRGKYSIGYNHDMSSFAPNAHLTASVWKWGELYTYILKQVKQKKWKSENIWWGLKHGVVDIAPTSKTVPLYIKNKVLIEKQKLIKNDTIFQGPINDQKGRPKIKAGRKLTNEQIYNMNWFVEGVVGSIHN